MRKYQIFTRCQRKLANCSWRITRNWKVSWGGSGSGRSIKALPNGLGTGAIKNHHIDLSLLISRVFVKATVNNSLNQRYIFSSVVYFYEQKNCRHRPVCLNFQPNRENRVIPKPRQTKREIPGCSVFQVFSYIKYNIWYIQQQLYFKLSLWREIFQ